MSSEGLKMGGGRYGLACNGRKTKKSSDPRWRSPLSSPARSERLRRRLAVKFHGQGHLVVALLPGWRFYLGGACIKGVAGNVSHGQNSFGLKTGRNDPIRDPQVLRNFSRVLEMKISVLGLGSIWHAKLGLYRA